ncbi:3-hydroxyisobutyrate dehydrogenase [Thermomonospora echinospora]|uniref:3-hydroxyisobutyrate dehydrogenase n=1 Tax=Thermomonospora echinospora TaxID=1992 RepID=A0A1H6C9M3_9ACTN|nr:NAD(P)-binding domain-containing protein [Thermomonospora echinospora]SEG69670.1 3-hydroxyisobutyrate dehydrogenase [Thermomonospora echinospora]
MHNGDAPVTVIGLGAMGAAMAEAFLKDGRPTTVWNRTAAKADPLVDKGAQRASTPAEALAAGELVVISQLDYPAMYDTFAGAEAALDGKVLVNLSSGTPQELREAAGWAAGHGARLVTGGIMVPPPGIGTPDSYVFYSGPEPALDTHRKTLETLGAVTYVGADPGLAMLYYQAMLMMFWSTLTSYFHAVALVGSAGATAEDLRPFAARLYGQLTGDGPMGFLPILTREIDAREYPGEQNSLHMQAVGAAHVVEAFRDAGLHTGMPGALRDLFAQADAAGHGAEGLTSVIEVIRDPQAASGR